MASNVSFLQAPRSDAELAEPARFWLVPAAIVDGRVAVIDANKQVSWKRVTTGVVREGRIEITSGVKEGDRVVVRDADALREKQLVRLNEG
jgi:hypothetical protein